MMVRVFIFDPKDGSIPNHGNKAKTKFIARSCDLEMGVGCKNSSLVVDGYCYEVLVMMTGVKVEIKDKRYEDNQVCR
jgi:hypothetical protein